MQKNRQAYVFKKRLQEIVTEAYESTGTFRELAEYSRLSNYTISRMKNGYDVSLDSICKVLDALGYVIQIEKMEMEDE